MVTTSTAYDYNPANQLESWTESNGAGGTLRSALIGFDERGNRDTQTVTLPGGIEKTTQYDWDFQNRLVSVTDPQGGAHAYAYDYRSRRIARSEPGGATAVSWSGGLSLAEYPVTGLQGTVADPEDPTVEYRRGPDMGGGIGGLLHSLRNGAPKYNLGNGRGDVVAQSDQSGALTWTASYEAFGTRPVETGSNADRQRANTKEEDPTGLLWEHFRYRDLETGVWLSRDPAGFVDGPNLYAYVRQNPWSKFDPLGLEAKVEETRRDDGRDQIKITVTAKIVNDYSKEYTQEERDQIEGDIRAGIESISGESDDLVWSTSAEIEWIESARDIKESDHVFRFTDENLGQEWGFGLGNAVFGHTEIALNPVWRLGSNGMNSFRNMVGHEMGHSLGLRHPRISNRSNADVESGRAWYSKDLEKWNGLGFDEANPITNLGENNLLRQRGQGTNTTPEQIRKVQEYYESEHLNGNLYTPGLTGGDLHGEAMKLQQKYWK